MEREEELRDYGTKTVQCHEECTNVKPMYTLHLVGKTLSVAMFCLSMCSLKTHGVFYAPPNVPGIELQHCVICLRHWFLPFQAETPVMMKSKGNLRCEKTISYWKKCITDILKLKSCCYLCDIRLDNIFLIHSNKIMNAAKSREWLSWSDELVSNYTKSNKIRAIQ